MLRNSYFAFIIVILLCFNISFILSAKKDTLKEVNNGCPGNFYSILYLITIILKLN
jgi:hypothetical protein